MSKKRFSSNFYEEDGRTITDNGNELTQNEVVDLLNEQQATIQSLKEDKAIAEDYANIFEKENVKLRKQIGEQQATIRRLQDLCGESDGENAKLRIENKRLEEENEQLKKARDESDKFIVKKGLEIEFLEWCIK